jgi:hypothetical protein
VTSDAFYMLWESRGWKLLTEEQALHSEALGRTITGPLSPEEQAELSATQGFGPGDAAADTTVTEVPFDPNAGQVADAALVAEQSDAAPRKTRATADVKEQ